MDGRGLSPREKRTLTAIERELRADPRFVRAMATGTGLLPDHRPPGSGGRHLPLRRVVCALALLSLVLLPPAAATSVPALVWAFALSYAATLSGLVVLVRRWCRRQG